MGSIQYCVSSVCLQAVSSVRRIQQVKRKDRKTPNIDSKFSHTSYHVGINYSMHDMIRDVITITAVGLPAIWVIIIIIVTWES